MPYDFTRSPEYNPHEEVSRGPSAVVGSIDVGMPDTSGVAKAAGDFGAKIVSTISDDKLLKELRGRASGAAKAAKARSGLAADIQTLTQKYGAIDGAEKVADFTKELEQKQTERLGSIDDDVLRNVVAAQMAPQIGAAVRGVTVLGAAREQQAVRDDLASHRSTMLGMAADAVTPEERNAAVMSFDSVVNDAASAGWIDPRHAAAEKFGLRAALDEGDATREIDSNPAGAALLIGDDDRYPHLQGPSRERLTQAAYIAERALPFAEQARAETDAFKGLRLGTLDLSGVTREEIPPAVQQRLAGMLEPQMASAVEGGTYHRLLDRAVDDARGALLDAADAYRAGRIDKPAFDRIFDVSARFDAEIRDRPFAIDTRRDLIKALPHDNPAQVRALTDATVAFDQWLDQNPDADAAAARGQMLAIADGARGAAARELRTTLPLPRFFGGAREAIDADTLGAAAARLRDAAMRSEVSDDELIAQSDLMRQWRDVVRAAPKKGGP